MKRPSRLLLASAVVLTLAIGYSLKFTSQSVQSAQGLQSFIQPIASEANPEDPALNPTAMTLERLEEILEQEVENVEGFLGRWQFTIGDRPMLLITDISHDRMRVFTPILQAEELTQKEWELMMVANFYSALDARYAITDDGVVVSTFVHPLSTLQDQDFRSAIYQVANLAETFGSLYSSGILDFAPGQQPANAEDGGLEI